MALVECTAVRVTQFASCTLDDDLDHPPPDDGLIHRSQDDDAMVVQGEVTRFVPCLFRWLSPYEWREAQGAPNCIRCMACT